MTRVLGRRRLLLSAVAEGAGLDAMFRLMARELGVECWLLTGLGRVVGGTDASLPGPLALRLACEYLKADRLPAPTEVSAPGAGVGKYTLFGVGGAPRITSWFLACAGLAALRSDTPISVVTSDEVASHELLLATVPASVLRSFRERLLGPLVAYDNRHRAELLPTLREFLACSGSWNTCAAKMYVHVNTVRYRIRRIEDLTGRDLSSLDDQVDFFLALRIR